MSLKPKYKFRDNVSPKFRRLRREIGPIAEKAVAGEAQLFWSRVRRSLEGRKLPRYAASETKETGLPVGQRSRHGWKSVRHRRKKRFVHRVFVDLARAPYMRHVEEGVRGGQIKRAPTPRGKKAYAFLIRGRRRPHGTNAKAWRRLVKRGDAIVVRKYKVGRRRGRWFFRTTLRQFRPGYVPRLKKRMWGRLQKAWNS